MIRLTRTMRPLAAAAGHLLAIWLRTLRVRMCMPDGTSISLRDFQPGSALYAFSERDLFPIATTAERGSSYVLVAEGNDGDWATAMVAPLDCRVIRGSSLHHGLFALRLLVRTLAECDLPAAIAIDGPTGPAGEVKEGIVICAALTRRVIVPAAAAARWKLTFTGSWAAHYLPLPFSPVVIALGEPISVPKDAPRSEIAGTARTIANEIRRLRVVALDLLVVRGVPAETSAA
jgi:lysophospholipid acyltransferase (LPLAT)-like uncharacterized protein